MRGDTLNPIAAGFTLEDLARHLLTHPATAPLLNSALPFQSETFPAARTAQFESVEANLKTVVQTHTETPGLEELDRRAVDQFAAAMKLMLSQKSNEGMRGVGEGNR